MFMCVIIQFHVTASMHSIESYINAAPNEKLIFNPGGNEH